MKPSYGLQEKVDKMSLKLSARRRDWRLWMWNFGSWERILALSEMDKAVFGLGRPIIHGGERGTCG